MGKLTFLSEFVLKISSKLNGDNKTGYVSFIKPVLVYSAKIPNFLCVWEKVFPVI